MRAGVSPSLRWFLVHFHSDNSICVALVATDAQSLSRKNGNLSLRPDQMAKSFHSLYVAFLHFDFLMKDLKLGEKVKNIFMKYLNCQKPECNSENESTFITVI